MMVIIFNRRYCGITKEQMQELYRNSLILCNDIELNVAEIPDWAVDEAGKLIGKDFYGTILEKGMFPRNKMEVREKNKYDYPKLYNEIMIYKEVVLRESREDF